MAPASIAAYLPLQGETVDSLLSLPPADLSSHHALSRLSSAYLLGGQPDVAIDVARNAVQVDGSALALLQASMACTWSREGEWSLEGVRWAERAVASIEGKEQGAARSGKQSGSASVEGGETSEEDKRLALHALGVNWLLLCLRDKRLSASERSNALKRADEALTRAGSIASSGKSKAGGGTGSDAAGSRRVSLSSVLLLHRSLVTALHGHVDESLALTRAALKEGGGRHLLTWQLLVLLLTAKRRLGDAVEICRAGVSAMQESGEADRGRERVELLLLLADVQMEGGRGGEGEGKDEGGVGGAAQAVGSLKDALRVTQGMVARQPQSVQASVRALGGKERVKRREERRDGYRLECGRIMV